jgi:hypothetical protein
MAGAAQAQSDVYRFYVPRASSVARVEWSSPGAGWEVSVAFDSGRCEIACSYRRIRDRFSDTSLVHYLLRPPTTVRLYRDRQSEPETVIIDPAHVRHPKACAPASVEPDRPYAPPRNLVADHSPAMTDCGQATARDGAMVRAVSFHPAAHGAPLRI